MRESVSGCKPSRRFNPSNVNVVKSSSSMMDRTSVSRSLREGYGGRPCQLTFSRGSIVNLNTAQRSPINVAFENWQNARAGKAYFKGLGILLF